MKKIKLIIVLLTLCSCKSEKKNNDDTEVMVIEQKSLNKDQSKNDSIFDLDSFLKSKNKPHSVIMKKDFGGKFEVNEFSIFSDSIDYFVFKGRFLDNNFIKKDYRIALLLWPFDSDKPQLSEDSKKRNIDYDNLYSHIINKKIKDDEYLIFPVDTKISNYKKITARLYDMKIKGYLPGNFEVDYRLYSNLSRHPERGINNYDETLGRLLSINDIFGYKRKDNEINIVLRSENLLPKEELPDYRLVLRTFPYEADLTFLKEKAIKDSLKYDSWYFDLKHIKINSNNYIISYLDTPILDFNKIEIRLYDEIQKRYVGTPIIIKDFYVEELK